MAIRAIPGTPRRRSHLVHRAVLDLAHVTMAHRSASWLSVGDFGIDQGSVTMDVVAVRASGAYSFGADAFSYRALDGRLIVINENAYSGAIVDSGEGPGVVVQHVANTDPFPSTVHVGDEEI